GLMAAVQTTSMLMFIIIAASVLTNAMGFIGLPRALADYVAELGLSPAMLIVALSIAFIVLGCFLDGISVILLTTATIIPLVESVGIDLIWFGIYLVLTVEMSQITPPVGFNLFVLQSLTGRDMISIAKVTFPFFCLMGFAIVLIFWFPEIVTWLPATMTAR
ncbi:MAG: C4-dicarboxylate ABC transporter permease, partial [Gammaproteobacteria bacterium]